MQRNPHPSGRPIRRTETKGRPIWRIPDVEPNVPRLRQPAAVDAIGFVHQFSEPERDDDHE